MIDIESIQKEIDKLHKKNRELKKDAYAVLVEYGKMWSELRKLQEIIERPNEIESLEKD